MSQSRQRPVPEWVKELPNNHQILYRLFSDPKYRSTKWSITQLCELFPSISRRTVTRICSEFTEEEILKKSTVPGNYHLYQFRPIPGRVRRGISGDFVALTPSEFYGMLSRWSSNKWEPRIMTSYKALPRAVARLFFLAAEAANGSVISNDQIEEAVQFIQPFKQDLEQALKVVNSILATQEVQNKDQLPQFLISGVDDPMQLSGKIQRLLELN